MIISTMSGNLCDKVVILYHKLQGIYEIRETNQLSSKKLLKYRYADSRWLLGKLTDISVFLWIIETRRRYKFQHKIYNCIYGIYKYIL